MQATNGLVATRVARSRTVLGITAVTFLFTGAGMAPPASAAAAGTPPLPLVLSAPASPVGDLVPGGVGAAQFTVHNPNPFPARLESLSFGTVRSADPTGCPASMLGTRPVVLPSGDVVPASATAAAFRIAGAFTLSEQAPDQCQGVTFLVDTTLVANIDGQQITSSAGEAATPGGSSASSIPGILAYTGARVLAMAFFGGLLLVLGMAVSGLGALIRRRRGQQGRDG